MSDKEAAHDQIDRIEIRTGRDSVFVGDTIPIAMTVIGSDGNAIPDLHLTLEASDGIQLNIYAAPQSFTAIAAGPATVTARFRRSAGTLNLTVLSR